MAMIDRHLSDILKAVRIAQVETDGRIRNTPALAILLKSETD